MTGLRVTDLSLSRGGRRVLDRVTFDLAPGECLGLLGPNGAGKTTLMRAALSVQAHDGQSSLDALPPRARAKTCAWLPQMRDIAWPVPVEALIALGRLPHATPDPALTEAVIARMGLKDVRHRPATELSGGEQARVLIARALVQDTPLLMADEPIAGLDPAAQIATMRVFRDLAREGRGVMLALHDLGLAARYCTRLLLMKAGRIVADGPPRAVLTPARLSDVFGISGRCEETGQGPVLHIIDTVEEG